MVFRITLHQLWYLGDEKFNTISFNSLRQINLPKIKIINIPRTIEAIIKI
jgi:hypothetical protein